MGAMDALRIRPARVHQLTTNVGLHHPELRVENDKVRFKAMLGRDASGLLEFKGKAFTIQVAPEDCTGCRLCVNVCPAKDRTNPKHKAIDMRPQEPLREPERVN